MKDNMGIGALALSVLIFVVVAAFGILIVNQMGYSARDNTALTLTGITVATNGTLTDFGSSYPYVQTVTGCVNASDSADTLSTANYTVIEGTEDGYGGFVLKDSGVKFVGEDVNCSITYLKTTSGTTASNAGILIFSTLAGLVILLVLIMVIRLLINKLKFD